MASRTLLLKVLGVVEAVVVVLGDVQMTRRASCHIFAKSQIMF